ncbi:amino acid adenylation domain-containing protein [Variovorax boronicumulans]|uniref:non-ribosomal peptide synthetase n=1 Tax=Variovorax boronicumulans TaxID=436515 RepID=UPI00277D7391|nr:amino acid adenylation domain-containing protein [Variovorax boronicumulans]MDQ0037814.1 amino acid adenylation domain-containing protein [Variovorax boronicumulans]
MSVILEPTPATLALSPEQRAAGAMSQAAGAALTLRARIDGPLDVSRLRDAIEAASQVHGALRSAVVQAAGFRGLRQQQLDEMPALDWRSADLGGRADRDAALAGWLVAFAQEPLDIARGQVLRAGLVRLGDAQHALVLAASPFAADKGSLQNLFEQAAARYLGEPLPDEDDVFQYEQFVEWRLDLEGGDEAPQGRAYWDGYVGEAAALAAPQLRVRSEGVATAKDGQGRLLATDSIDAALLERVDDAAAKAGTTPQVVLQATWWLLLARLTELTEGGAFAGGWQHDCRHDYEVMQGSVGVFEKVLPVVVQVAPSQGFSPWLPQFGATLAAHSEAQEYWPIDAPPTSAHLGVGFAFNARHGARAGWQVDAVPGPMPCFELALQADRGNDGVGLSLHGDASRYSAAAAQRLLWQFHTLLGAALAQPDVPVSALPLVGDRERVLLLAFRGAALDVAVPSLSARIDHWADTTPDAPALEAGDLRLSYRALHARINRVAHWFAGQGVGAGSLVALNLPRSADLLIAMLASWRIGAGYLPMDPEWPAARRDAVLADAAPALVVHAAPDDEQIDALSPDTPTHAASPRDLAYVLYTSGSTGQPKGVVIEQGQLLNYVAAASAAMDLGRCRRWALTSSVVADLGNTALFGAFFNGACLVVAGPDDTRDARAFADFMRTRDIDALKMVPSHLEALLEDDAPRLPATLVLGGEATPRALVERLQRLAPACAVYNHYGPTETTVGVMVHRVSAGDAASPVMPLSQVLANNRVHVLDDALGLVPSGGLGAVYVGGAQLCRGYLNREPGDAFVADPFQPGERLYRTGDLAHVLPEGGLCLAGRADHQVKIRGFRVEPAEVEATLLGLPGVRQAAVLAATGSDGGVQLHAFVVGSDEAAQVASVIAQLGTLLPAHMVPAHCTVLAEFPRLPNGKIDRLGLLPLAALDSARPRQATAARDALEAVLADSMGRLLQRESIGIEEDFFELGGHSLLVIKLVARIRKLLRIDVAPGVVFDHASPAALAAALRAQSEDVDGLEQLASQALQPASRLEAAAAA